MTQSTAKGMIAIIFEVNQLMFEERVGLSKDKGGVLQKFDSNDCTYNSGDDELKEE